MVLLSEMEQKREMMWKDNDGSMYKLSYGQLKKWDDMISLLWVIAFLLIILVLVAIVGWMDLTDIPSRLLYRLWGV